MAQPSDSRVRPDDLATSWEAYPRDQLAETLLHAHGYGRNAPATLQTYQRVARAIPLAHRSTRYSWTDHRRRLYWRALIDVSGVLWILIALLWVVQSQAGH